MASQNPLTGIELIDCAKANSAQGVAIAADLCGYGTDTKTFLEAVRRAGDDMGVSIDELQDLDTTDSINPSTGLEISPGSLKEI